MPTMTPGTMPPRKGRPRNVGKLPYTMKAIEGGNDEDSPAPAAMALAEKYLSYLA
jgi:hypothetical protein